MAERKITPEMLEATRPLACLHIKKDLQKISDLIVTGLEAGSLATFGTGGHIEPPDGKLWNGKPFLKGETVRHAEFPITVGAATWIFNRYDVPGEQDAALLPSVETKTLKDGTIVCKLDLKRIEEGLAIWIQQSPHQYSLWVRDDGDFFTGDSFLQCCFFGEVVYG
jgi:hypothetical protein